MVIRLCEYLRARAAEVCPGIDAATLRLPDVTLDPHAIRVLMISEAPPTDADDGYYSDRPDAADRLTALRLLQDGGVAAQSMADLIARGVYVTTAIKTPKEGAAVDDATLTAQQSLLETELDLFPRLQIVMLMGNVAKKAFNRIAKARTGRNAIPAGATYKLRGQSFTSMGLRVFPSYILSGANLQIEKGKCAMIADDIRRMMELL